MKTQFVAVGLIVILMVAGPSVAPSALQPHLAAPAQVEQDYGQLPLYFVENQGQMDERVAYYLQGSDKTIYFAPDGVTFALTAPLTPTLSQRARERNDEGRTLALRGESDPQSAIYNPQSEIQPPSEIQRWAVKLDFVGANPDVRPIGQDKTEAVISYFKGAQDQWHAGLPTYSRLVYPDLWPGIDLVYYGTVNRLKYEFVVKPGADPAQIRLAYRGATGVQVNAAGQLEVTTPLGGFSDDTPVAYQDVDGRRIPVSMAYQTYQTQTSEVLKTSEVSVSTPYSFAIGDYDPARPLILDPAVIVYCGYIGGQNSDFGYSIAVDTAGNAYITGEAYSPEASFPVTFGPDLTYNGNGDAFVAKVNAAGTALVYAGYIGGSEGDHGSGIAVDSAGNAYISGETDSTEATFPVKGGPDLTFNGGGDAFVAKVNAAGTALVYAGYIGGSGGDFGRGVAVDSAGNAYVSGSTNSTQAIFPVKGGPDLTYNGGEYGDAFVAKVNVAGTALVYAGYIGGSDDDYGCGIAVDSAGNAYITGLTYSTQATFPVTGGPDLTYNGSLDAFVAKVNAVGSALVYAGYIGGSDYDEGFGIAVDSAGNAYVTGDTYSTEASFPVRGGPDLTYNGDRDAFVAKVNVAGTALVYAGYIGGSSYDFSSGIAANSAGNAYIAGRTSSTEASFPVTVGPDLTYNGDGHFGTGDAFVAKINAAGTALVYAGYIGGSDSDAGFGIAVDSSGNAYVTGDTASTEATFPVMGGPALTIKGNQDAFVAKVSIYEGPPPTYSISGRVTDVSSNSVPGVTISDGAGHTVSTDANGQYILNGLLQNSYTLVPSKSSCTFQPSLRTASVPPNATGQNFQANCTYNISGRVQDVNGYPFAGVTISADPGHSAVTNAAGDYALTDLASGSYTLVPSRAGYGFWPTTRFVTLPPDAAGQSFIILPGPVATTLSPGIAASLTFYDMQGLPTTFSFPVNAATQTTTLVLTPTLVGGGAGFVLAGHAFDLAASRSGHPLPGFTFGAPVTVTIRYSDDDIRLVSEESQLVLRWWAGSEWQDAAQTCNPPSSIRDLTNNAFSVPICHLSLFGLFGPTHQVYLPLVLKNY